MILGAYFGPVALYHWKNAGQIVLQVICRLSDLKKQAETENFYKHQRTGMDKNQDPGWVKIRIRDPG
jgi:hypothetical protein